MRVAPGRGFVFVVVMMAMIVIMMRMAMAMMRVIVAVMVVPMMRMRGSRLRPHETQQRPALHPQKPQADHHDERIADDLDDAHRVAHCLGGGVEHDRQG